MIQYVTRVIITINIGTAKLEQNIVDITFIDISHESLLRLWIKLRQWIKEERESIENYVGLSESAALYQLGKVSLLTNPELQMILNWRATNEPSIQEQQIN